MTDAQLHSSSDYQSRADRARAVFAPSSSRRFQDMQQLGRQNQQSQQNARNPLGKKHTFKFTGGSKLEVTLEPGMNPDKPNDKLMKLVDKAAEGRKDLAGQRIELKNTNPKAKLTYAPKTPMKVERHTFAELPKYGKTDIQYHNTTGTTGASLHGMAQLTMTGTTDYSGTAIGRGNVDMRVVGDNVKGNRLNVAHGASYRGDVAAHSADAHIIGGNQYGVKGSEAKLAGAELGGKPASSLAPATQSPTNVIRLDVHKEDPRMAAAKKLAAQKAARTAHLEAGQQAFQSSNRKKVEFPVPKVA